MAINKRFDFITIFPGILNSYFQESLFKRAQNNNLLTIEYHNLRKWTDDRHQTVDDRPYGGGVGLIFKIEPIYRALKAIRKRKKHRVILLNPTGKLFNQKKAKELVDYDQLIFICGRYEGVDARVERFIDEKISIGNYILTGGELPAAVITDAVCRHLPGFVGKQESVAQESFSRAGYLEYPQYTRPEIFTAEGKRLKVPKILLSGNHLSISQWRRQKSKLRK